jgi:Glycosyltransferase 61
MSNKRSSSHISVILYVLVAFFTGRQVGVNTSNELIISIPETTTKHVDTNQEPSLQVSPQDLSIPKVQQKSQFTYTTVTARRPDFGTNPTTCEHQWDWPFLDAWEKTFLHGENQNVTAFQVRRSNAHPTAEGTIRMNIIQPTQVPNHTVSNNCIRPNRVVIYVTHVDTIGANAWHRVAVQYMVWIAWQVAEHRVAEVWTTITHVELLLPCVQLGDVPQGWNDLLFTINKIDSSVALANTTLWCTNEWNLHSVDDVTPVLQPLLEQRHGSATIDAIVVPPNDGLLWDLAWDETFQCKESHMFRTFMSQFAKLPTLSSARRKSEYIDGDISIQDSSVMSTVVCWILRYGNIQRDIINRDDVHGMLLSIFDTVRLIHLTRYHTSKQISNSMHDCQVFYGVHGAGMVNAMWGSMSYLNRTAVVEVLPDGRPQYFRSVSALVGHHYEGIVTEYRMEHSQYQVDLQTSAEALHRALTYIRAE